VTILLVLWMAFADIASVKAEADLEKRSELALANADEQVDAARRAYSAADMKAQQAALDEVRESVETSYEALEHTNKAPRKSRYYKRAELKVQALLRRLRTLRDDVNVDDRGAVESVMKRLQEIHDELLIEIMSKKKKD
jgi:hypothetical protein